MWGSTQKASGGMELSCPPYPYPESFPVLSIPPHSLLCSWFWFSRTMAGRAPPSTHRSQLPQLPESRSTTPSRVDPAGFVSAAAPSLTARARHSFPGRSSAHPSPFQARGKGWRLSQGLSGCQGSSAMARLPRCADELIPSVMASPAPQKSLLRVRRVGKDRQFPRRKSRGEAVFPGLPGA